MIQYAAWHDEADEQRLLIFVLYLLGVLASCYHLAYGIWNFCIRWGITISDRAQRQVQHLSLGIFVVLTLLGWAALFGFLRSPGTTSVQTVKPPSVAQR